MEEILLVIELLGDNSDRKMGFGRVGQGRDHS